MIPPCVKRFRNTRSTSPKPASRIDRRATTTISTGVTKRCWCNRKASRMSRRARLRTTEFPIFLEVTTPRREAVPSGFASQFTMRQPRTKRRPSVLSRVNSWLCRRRLSRPKVRRPVGASAICGSGRRQALAAVGTTFCEDGASAFAAAARQKTVLPFAANLRWLIGSFHMPGLKVKKSAARRPQSYPAETGTGEPSNRIPRVNPTFQQYQGRLDQRALPSPWRAGRKAKR